MYRIEIPHVSVLISRNDILILYIKMIIDWIWAKTVGVESLRLGDHYFLGSVSSLGYYFIHYFDGGPNLTDLWAIFRININAFFSQIFLSQNSHGTPTDKKNSFF